MPTKICIKLKVTTSVLSEEGSSNTPSIWVAGRNFISDFLSSVFLYKDEGVFVEKEIFESLLLFPY